MTTAPLLDHLDELRSRIIKSVLAVLLGAVAAFVFRDQILELLIAPYKEVTSDQALAFFRPTEAFSLTMRISFFGGFVLSSPVVIYQLWAFISPALT